MGRSLLFNLRDPEEPRVAVLEGRRLAEVGVEAGGAMIGLSWSSSADRGVSQGGGADTASSSSVSSHNAAKSVSESASAVTADQSGSSAAIGARSCGFGLPATEGGGGGATPGSGCSVMMRP